MTILQQLMDRINNLGPSSNNSIKKLLDIHINFDERYPVVTYTYFDKENRTEIIETYRAFSLVMKQGFNNDIEYHAFNDRRMYFDKTFELRDMSLIDKRINKL